MMSSYRSSGLEVLPLLLEDAAALRLGPSEAPVELHAADRGEVVALRREEQVVEEVLGRFLGGRFAGAHHPVDLDERLEAGARDVAAERVRDVGTAVEVVGVDRLDGLDARLQQLVEDLVGDRRVAGDDDLPGPRVDHVAGGHAPEHVLAGHVETLQARPLQHAHVARRDAAARFDDDVAVAVDDVERGRLAPHALGHEVHRQAVLLDVEDVLVEEQVQDLLRREPQRAQHDRRRQLAPAVDAHVHEVLGIELEVEPGAPVGNDPGGVQELPGRVGLPLVVVEEHARRAVQLGHHDPLGAVDDEGAVVRHERYLAHVDFLLLHVLDRLAGRLAVVDDEPHPHPQRRRVGHPAGDALLDVEGRLAEAVVHVLERGVARVAHDRKHRAERRVQARVATLARLDVELQEPAVGVELDGEKVRQFHGLRQPAEVLADTLLLGEPVSHSSLRLVRRQKTRAGPAAAGRSLRGSAVVPGARPARHGADGPCLGRVRPRLGKRQRHVCVTRAGITSPPRLRRLLRAAS